MRATIFAAIITSPRYQIAILIVAPFPSKLSRYRPGNGRAVRGHHEGQAASRAGFRSCLGIISLLKTYGVVRVEAACRRGNDIGATTYGSIASILKHGLDKAYADDAREAFVREGDEAAVQHGNIRGRDYYH